MSDDDEAQAPEDDGVSGGWNDPDANAELDRRQEFTDHIHEAAAAMDAAEDTDDASEHTAGFEKARAVLHHQADLTEEAATHQAEGMTTIDDIRADQ